MYDKDFAELVKIAAEKLKEDTVYKMLTRSEDYQKESDERDKAERNYEQLDLTMEQRKVCDVFLDYRDRQSLGVISSSNQLSSAMVPFRNSVLSSVCSCVS